MESDLDALLDDALADFDKPAPSFSPSASSSVDKKQQENEKREPSNPILQPPINMFQEFFDGDISEKLQEEWNSAMKELKEEDPDLANHLKMMSKNLDDSAASSNSQNSAASQTEGFDAKMKEALESVAKSASQDIPPEDVLKNMFNLNLNDDSSQPPEGDFAGLGMMEDMMKMMLSKDMLYPPMNEMRKNFPEWLEKNKETISQTDKKNYEKQLECLEIICKEFESETDSDSESIKKKRFTVVMNAVNEMQQYGQPPASLLGEGESLPLPQETCTIS